MVSEDYQWTRNMSSRFVFLLSSFCCFVAIEASFLVTINPTRVETGITHNVTVTCSYWGESSLSSLEKITMIRILHQKTTEPFSVVAEIRDNENNVHTSGLNSGVVVSGAIKTLDDSFVEILWPVATPDLYGHYRCDVIGFSITQDIITEKSPIVSILETNVTANDVLELLIREKEEMKSYCDARVAASESNFQTLLNNLRREEASNNDILENTLRGELSALREDVNRLMETGVLQYWPEGTYALLSPQAGCPNNVGAIWTTGLVKIHTESTDRNYDQVSTNSHLLAPILERAGTNNFMYQHFCVSTTLSPGAAWPKGSYCINRKGDKCPTGFETGSIQWNEERTGSAGATTGAIPDGTYTAAIAKIFYCCRNDSDPFHPVYLPKARPFYLYRFKGTCQDVVGMKVTPELMVFDTDTTNADAYDNDWHPDGQINDVHLLLCYYEERV
ncbi:hypothetical protein BgiMline_020655 [Biomphalaria glabrata]